MLHKRTLSRGRKRLLIVALAVLVVLAGAGITGAWAYEQSLSRNLARTDAFAGLSASGRPTQAVTGAMNILLLGSDSRDPSSTTNSRSDTIMLLHLDADHQHAYVISIPRDTWVYVPASADHKSGDTMAKINSAYAWGGAPLTVQTVETFTGVHLDHVVLVDFAGFQQVTDALGGVDMNIEKTIKSIHPPYRTFTKGTQHLSGAEALDYVRQRYQFADGDLSRARHQQQFLQALLDKAVSGGTLANPAKLDAFLQAVTKSVTVDNNFDLVNVALQLRSLRTSNLTFLASPTAGFGLEAGQSVVRADTAKAKALYQAVADDKVAQYLAPAQPTQSTSPLAAAP
jgi:LCP family protein required for cell wall assembly